MNKNRYKLIFSQSKSCLVPVAECIKSAVGNGSSDAVNTTESDAEEPPLAAPHALSPVPLWVKNTFNPVSSVMQLTWKHVSVLLLTIVSAPVLSATEDVDPHREETLNALAKIKTQELKKIGEEQNIQLDKTNSGKNNNTIQLHHTENNVLVIDITKPNDKGVSDNRFQKFIVPNGAIFRNNNAQARSEIVGYLDANPNLKNQKLADVILTQVTGSAASTIKGALEVLGQQADLVIANQNGITLNGAKAINAKHFLVTTSSLIDPDKLELEVTKGTVTIDVNGFATDGLPYLDIIAKKIEQKQSILPEIDKSTQTKITMIAGESQYNLEKHTLTKRSGKDAQEGEIAITGASTGAMHGKHTMIKRRSRNTAMTIVCQRR
ncbi:protein PfhB2 [Pasteurella multocida subsp. multocida OH4807]|nr:protein PfhB2 [Pasteurella multocida subsp. multocida OH4807]